MGAPGVVKGGSGASMRHPRLIVSSILACLLIFAAALVLHQGDGGQSMQGGGVTLEQKSTVAKFNEWWSRIQKVQGDIIKLKNEANKKADEEVHTLSEVKDLVRQLSVKWPSDGMSDDGVGTAAAAHPPPLSLPKPAVAEKSEPEKDLTSESKVVTGSGWWSYGKGPTGPAFWSELSTKYSLCGSGRAQSPISIDSAKAGGNLPSVSWIVARTGELDSNAKSSIEGEEGMSKPGLSVMLTNGPEMVVGDTKYMLEKMLFHTPAEHIIKGDHAEAEVQFMHTATDGSGKRLGVALFLDSDKSMTGTFSESSTGFLETLVSDVAKGSTKHVIDVHALSREVLVGTMPDDPGALAEFSPNFRSYFQYDGSITAPPCTEGVTWVVLKNHVTVDGDKLATLQELQGKNSRPVQPLNGRTVSEVDNMAEP